MKVSVIVPSYNGAEKLRQLMVSLKKQSLIPSEVIVVLDGSTDNSKMVLEPWIKKLPIKIVEQENRGRASARNRGASEAKGQLLVFYDDDTIPNPDSLKRHFELRSIFGPCIIAGQQLEKVKEDNEFTKFKMYLTSKWVANLGSVPLPLSFDNLFLTAANMSVDSEIFRQLNGFDSQLLDAEDFDLAVRAHSQNMRVIYDPLNKVEHESFNCLTDYITRQREYRKGHEKLWEKRKTTSYSDYYLRYQITISPLKKVVYFFFPLSLITLIDKGFLKWMPQKLRFNAYKRIIAAFSIYFPHKKIN